MASAKDEEEGEDKDDADDVERPPSSALASSPPSRSYSVASTISRTDSQCSCMSCFADGAFDRPPRHSKVGELGAEQSRDQ